MSGDPPPPLAGLHEGTRLGDYVLVAYLGGGGQGQVWEAAQISLGRPVALKILLSISPVGDQLARLRREAEAMSKVTHEGIAALHGIETVGEYTFLVMELVRGEPLDARMAEWREIRKRPRGVPFPRVVARIALEIAEALAAAHERGVVHRDVKPSNVLLTTRDRVKVVDFGLARSDDSASLTRSTDMVGTPYYMSPEQVHSDNRDLDGRSDVFSLGVTLYEMLVGERPFLGGSTPAVVNQVVSYDPPPPHRRVGQVDRDLSTICMKALEKSRGERYATMAAFAEDLRRVLADEPILARPPGPVRRLVKWAKRRPAVATATVVGTLTLVVVSIALTITRNTLAATDSAVELLLGAIRTTTPDESASEITVAEAYAQVVDDEAFTRAPEWLQVELLAEVARSWVRRGDLTDATPLLERLDALAGAEGWRADDPRLFAARWVRASIASRCDRLDEAHAILEALIEDTRDQLPPRDLFAIILEGDLGVVLQKQRRYEAALPLSRSALRRFEELEGDPQLVLNARARLDPASKYVLNMRAQLMANLAMVLDALGGDAYVREADGLWDEALRFSVAHVGRDHPATLSLLSAHALRTLYDDRLSKHEAFRRAESRYQWVLLTTGQTGLQSGTAYASTARNLGLALDKHARRIDEDRVRVDTACEELSEAPDPGVTPCWDAARALLLEAAQLRRAHLGADEPTTVEAVFSAANTTLRAGLPAQALGVLAELQRVAVLAALDPEQDALIAYLRGRASQALGDETAARLWAAYAVWILPPDSGKRRQLEAFVEETGLDPHAIR